MSSHKKPILFILGPTASGKTALSLRIAERYNGEIISGDSMQVYRGMDIGTAKATLDERGGIPHHLIDCANPDDPYSVAHFQEQAKAAAASIWAKGKLPIVAGGTGLYAEALMFDYPFEAGEGETELRVSIRQRVKTDGLEAMHRELAAADPDAASRIHPNDEQRIVRALELVHAGERPSEKRENTRKESPYQLYVIGLTMPRDILYERINLRVLQMVQAGWLEEVRNLLAAGYDQTLPSMRGLGYKEWQYYLRGLTTHDETVRLIQRNTRRFAKRQLSWFRHMEIIDWFELENYQLKHEHWQKICATIESKLLMN